MDLRVLLDQNVPRSLCAFLQMRHPEWTTDSAILQWAQGDQSIVITFDEDFADARMYPAGSHHGVIRLRVWPTTVEVTEAALQRILDEVRDEDLRGSLVIVDRSTIRIRRSIRHG